MALCNKKNRQFRALLPLSRVRKAQHTGRVGKSISQIVCAHFFRDLLRALVVPQLPPKPGKLNQVTRRFRLPSDLDSYHDSAGFFEFQQASTNPTSLREAIFSCRIGAVPGSKSTTHQTLHTPATHILYIEWGDKRKKGTSRGL